MSDCAFSADFWKVKAEGRSAAERLSHEGIYALIGTDLKEGGTQLQILPWGGRTRRQDRCGTRRGHWLKVTPAQEIAARPAVIAERRHTGAWEVER